jgi:ribosomal protein L31
LFYVHFKLLLLKLSSRHKAATRFCHFFCKEASMRVNSTVSRKLLHITIHVRTLLLFEVLQDVGSECHHHFICQGNVSSTESATFIVTSYFNPFLSSTASM